MNVNTYLKKHHCSNCIHDGVCVHKKQFMDTVEAINRLTIHVSENALIYCRDLKWLAGIIPICKNYRSESDEDSKYDGFLGLG